MRSTSCKYMSKKIIVYSLSTFGSTGGIQKMTRALAHSLYNLSLRNSWDFKFWSVYDKSNDLIVKYLPAENFTGFGAKRIKFVLGVVKSTPKPDLIILTHINLALVGLLIKLIKPACKIWLIAHGIEVWRPLSPIKSRLLRKCDKILCVSNYTKQQMISRHHVDPAICGVLNNSVDPFMKITNEFTKPEKLLKTYKLTAETPVLFTLTRLASSEQYKGHDQVIKIISRLRKVFPGIRYILAGQYDHEEEIRIQQLISANDVDKEVILTGFLEESELPDYFLLADLFVLPSKKEGFGIVFIEALACGLPVICGNADGSTDAILNGELGKAIDADNLEELERAIVGYLETPLKSNQRVSLQHRCLSHFNESQYMNKLEKLIKND